LHPAFAGSRAQEKKMGSRLPHAAGLASLGPRVRGSRAVNVVVETPAGSRNKFKLDEESGAFLLHKVLPVGASFPFDFGFVPGTRAEDGDPLDVMLLGEEPTFTGCLVTARLLGVIEAEQKQKGKAIRNDRLIATAETEKIRPAARSLADVPSHILEQIDHFFAAYNRYEGREFVTLRRRGPQAAERRLEMAIRARRRP
jgi:inorganic pyrophosphatase